MLKITISILIIIFLIILFTLLALILKKWYKNNKLYKKTGGGPGNDTDELSIDNLNKENIYNCDFDKDKFISVAEGFSNISDFIIKNFDDEIDKLINIWENESGEYILKLLKVDDFKMNNVLYKRFRNKISKKLKLENKKCPCSNCTALENKIKTLTNDKNDSDIKIKLLENKIKTLENEKEQSTNLLEAFAKSNSDYLKEREENARKQTEEIRNYRDRIGELETKLERVEREQRQRQRLVNRHVWITRQANDANENRLRSLYEEQLESLASNSGE